MENYLRSCDVIKEHDDLIYNASGGMDFRDNDVETVGR